MDQVKEMVAQWLAHREEVEARRIADERNEQVRRDYAELGRVYDPYD